MAPTPGLLLSDLYPGLAVRISAAFPETAKLNVEWARVWYVSERRLGAVMLITWQRRTSPPWPLLVDVAWLIPEQRPADPPEMPAWARCEVVGV